MSTKFIKYLIMINIVYSSSTLPMFYSDKNCSQKSNTSRNTTFITETPTVINETPTDQSNPSISDNKKIHELEKENLLLRFTHEKLKEENAKLQQENALANRIVAAIIILTPSVLAFFLGKSTATQK